PRQTRRGRETSGASRSYAGRREFHAGIDVIRVLLVDDHQVVRRGLAGLLRDEPGIEIVGEAADGQEAVEQALRLQPDVIIMDVSMPRMNGIDATRAIVTELPQVAVIGMSMHDQADLAQSMRAAGAVTSLTKGGPTAG